MPRYFFQLKRSGEVLIDTAWGVELSDVDAAARDSMLAIA